MIFLSEVACAPSELNSQVFAIQKHCRREPALFGATLSKMRRFYVCVAARDLISEILHQKTRNATNNCFIAVRTKMLFGRTYVIDSKKYFSYHFRNARSFHLTEKQLSRYLVNGTKIKSLYVISPLY